MTCAKDLVRIICFSVCMSFAEQIIEPGLGSVVLATEHNEEYAGRIRDDDGRSGDGPAGWRKSSGTARQQY